MQMGPKRFPRLRWWLKVYYVGHGAPAAAPWLILRATHSAWIMHALRLFTAGVTLFRPTCIAPRSTRRGRANCFSLSRSLARAEPGRPSISILLHNADKLHGRPRAAASLCCLQFCARYRALLSFHTESICNAGLVVSLLPHHLLPVPGCDTTWHRVGKYIHS